MGTGLIIWFVLTILLMGFFAGIEMAFYSANRLGIELKKKQGNSTGILLGRFFESPARFLGTTLLGFAIFLVLFGLQLGDVMKPMWEWLKIGSSTVHLLVEIALSTFVVLVFAEFIPRAIFRARSNNLLSRLARIIYFFYQALSPLAAGLTRLSEWALKYVFNVRMDESRKAFANSDFENFFLQSNDPSEEKKDLINKFSRERKSIAWVVDEFGGTAGIITMKDVLEEIFGDIKDEYDMEEFVENQIAENEYILSGRLELDYLNDKFGFNFPEDESETLSGYIINFHETIPRQKERIIINDYEFDILDVSDTRIEMVKLKKLK